MAEALINKLGAGRYRGFSAGSRPAGKVHPFALHALNLLGYRTDCLSSKGWDEFSRHDAPHMDLIITVCRDVAEAESPAWPGQPIKDLWELEDPGTVRPDRQFEAFVITVRSLQRLIGSLIGSSIEFMERSNRSGWNPGSSGAYGHSRH